MACVPQKYNVSAPSAALCTSYPLGSRSFWRVERTPGSSATDKMCLVPSVEISVENPPCIGSELMSAPHVPTGLTPVGCCCLSGIRPRAGKTVEIHPVRWGSTHRQPSPVPRGFESSLRHVSNRRGPLEGVVVPPRSLWCGVHPAFVLEKHVSAGAGRSSCGRHRSAASVQAARRHRAAGCRQRLVRSARRNPVCTSAGTLAVCRGVQIPISECLPRYGTESRTSDLDESPPGRRSCGEQNGNSDNAINPANANLNCGSVSDGDDKRWNALFQEVAMGHFSIRQSFLLY